MFILIVQLIFKIIVVAYGVNSYIKMKNDKKIYWEDFWTMYLIAALTILVCSF